MTNQTLETPKPKNKYIGVLFGIYTIATMAIYILPYTKLMYPYIPVAILMMASLPLIMFRKNEWSLYGAALCFITFVFFCIGHWSLVDGINDAVRNLRLFLPIIWGAYAIRNCSKKQRIFILLGFTVVTVIILYNSIIALEEEPWIARILAQDQNSSTDEVNEYRLRNVGGYAFSYMVGAITVCIAWLALRLKKIWQKILCIVAVVFCYSYIIQTMYTTLLILTTVCIFLLLIVCAKNVMTKYILLVVALGIFLGISPLLKYLGGVFSSDSLLSDKFDQMYLAVSGEGVDALGLRPTLIKQALENWAKTPLLGDSYSTHAHSLFFEMLQSSGIIGTGLWICLFSYTWCFMHKELKSNGVDPLIFNVAMIYFAALSVFNDTRYTFEITIAVFFIIPLLASVVSEKKSTTKEKD